MRVTEISDGIYLMHQNNEERSVLVCGEQWATAIDAPSSKSGKNALSDAAKKMTVQGVRQTIYLNPELFATETVDGAKVNTMKATGSFWASDLTPAESNSILSLRETTVVYDDSGHLFRCVPIGSAMTLCIEPELVFICNEDLDPHLPPKVRPGHSRQILKLLKHIIKLKPNMLVPASGKLLKGQAMERTLDSALCYMEKLVSEVQTRLAGSLPKEYLAYSLNWAECWTPGEINAGEELIARHRKNVMNVADDCSRHYRDA